MHHKVKALHKTKRLLAAALFSRNYSFTGFEQKIAQHGAQHNRSPACLPHRETATCVESENAVEFHTTAADSALTLAF